MLKRAVLVLGLQLIPQSRDAHWLRHATRHLALPRRIPGDIVKPNDATHRAVILPVGSYGLKRVCPVYKHGIERTELANLLDCLW